MKFLKPRCLLLSIMFVPLSIIEEPNTKRVKTKEMTDFFNNLTESQTIKLLNLKTQLHKFDISEKELSYVKEEYKTINEGFIEPAKKLSSFAKQYTFSMNTLIEVEYSLLNAIKGAEERVLDKEKAKKWDAILPVISQLEQLRINDMYSLTLSEMKLLNICYKESKYEEFQNSASTVRKTFKKLVDRLQPEIKYPLELLQENMQNILMDYSDSENYTEYDTENDEYSNNEYAESENDTELETINSEKIPDREAIKSIIDNIVDNVIDKSVVQELPIIRVVSPDKDLNEGKTIFKENNPEIRFNPKYKIVLMCSDIPTIETCVPLEEPTPFKQIDTSKLMWITNEEEVPDLVDDSSDSESVPDLVDDYGNIFL